MVLSSTSPAPITDPASATINGQDVQKVFAERFGKVLDDKEIPKGYGRITVVQKEFEVSQPTAARWVHGNSLPDALTLLKMAAWANRPVGWLLGDRITEEISGRPAELHPLRDLNVAMDEAVRVRMAGAPLRESRWLAVQSSSFRPIWNNGDYVVFAPTHELPVDSDFAIIRTDRGEALRYVEVHPDGYIVRSSISDAGSWIPNQMARDSLLVVGRVMYKISPSVDPMPAASGDARNRP